VQKAENLHQVVSNIIPPLMQTVLVDYNANVEQARDAEVLGIMATIVSRLEVCVIVHFWIQMIDVLTIFVTGVQVLITGEVPGILDAVFECTLNMINKDLSEYPEHRVAFFKLLRAINQSCFPGNHAFR
jgi:exportin-1